MACRIFSETKNLFESHRHRTRASTHAFKTLHVHDAEVFEGTHKGTKVAIKTLKDVAPAGVQDFLLEADMMTYVWRGC